MVREPPATEIQLGRCIVFELNPSDPLESLIALVTAFVLALPIAWNREKGSRQMGLRTLPLVAIASCGYVLVGTDVAAGDPQALSRLIQGLMTGIGFIGGGAILKSSRRVQGTATAAAIWATGAVGAAAAFGRVELAIMISAITFVTFLVLTPLGRYLDEGEEGEGRATGD